MQKEAEEWNGLFSWENQTNKKRPGSQSCYNLLNAKDISMDATFAIGLSELEVIFDRLYVSALARTSSCTAG